MNRAARKRSGDPLREFVYLDEVSVFSLISSRVGGVATDFTDTQSNALRTETSTSTGAGAALIKTEVRSGSEATRSSETQVLRKATIQGTFRELYGKVKEDLVLRLPASEAPSAIHDQVGRAVAAAVADGAATPVADLRRGRLLEVEVELEAEAIFHFITLMDTLLEMAQDLPEEFVPGLRGQLGNVMAMNAMMGKLLVGLVPLRATAIHHAVLSTADGEWVVDRRWFVNSPGAELRPLEVVAMAEVPLFWRDLRRVLFSGSRYTMLCRIGRDGLQDSWNPVKLADLLKNLLPELEQELGDAQRQLAAAMQGASTVPLAQEGDEPRLRHALSAYGEALAAHHKVKWRFEDIEGALSAATGHGMEHRRPAFDFVAAAFQQESEVDLDPLVRAQLRHEAAVAAGMVPGEGVAEPQALSPAAVGTALTLETEIVAIYW